MQRALLNRVIRTSLIPVLAATVLAACGSGSGQDGISATEPEVKTGVLVDSPISGVFWETESGNSGLTTGDGEFDYTEIISGSFVDLVTFSIGDIVLGSVAGAAYITAVELTNSFAPTDRAALNQLVFLQSIDEDGDPDNGITISEATRTAAIGQSLDFDSPNFATEVAAVVAVIAPGNTVVSESDALDHFYSTYAALGGTDSFNFGFPGYPPVGEGADNFVLVFADEFDQGFAPNPDVWNIDLGYGPNDSGWGNNEWQLYTDSPSNLRVEDGNLVITARCPVEPCGLRDGTITSARITSTDKFEFRYGKVVARIKVPVGQGIWPAFWALGASFPEGGWPRSGEIDFMEVFNNTNNTPEESAVAERTATSAMHWCDETIVTDPQANCFPAGRLFVTDKLELDASLGDDFQIWETDWTADKVTVSINGIQYFELDIDPATMEEFRKDFFLLLNVAVGGTLGSGSQPPQGDEPFPQTMLVDYVRVYQQVDDVSPPELTTVTIGSDGANPGFAKTGDVVTVSLNTNETILEPTVTINSVAATNLTGSGQSWQASRTLTDADDEGDIEFTIDFVDLAGNAGVTTSQTTDNSSVVIDTTAPGIGSASITSNNANDPGQATTGDVVTVSLSANEGILPPTVTIGGAAATTTSGAGANWTASRTLGAGENQGEIAFTINYQDFAGNAGAPVSAPTDASSVTIDSIAPDVALNGAPPMFTTLAPINLQVNFTEAVTGFAAGDIQVGNGAVSNFAGSGNLYSVDITPNGLGNLIVGIPAGAAADAAGNLSTAAADVTIINNLPAGEPLLTTVTIASSNGNPTFARTGDVVTVSLTANRDIQQPTITIAGFAADNVSGSGANWQATRTAQAGDPEGPIAFVINYQDLMGTAGPESTVTTDGSAVEFDITAPALEITGLPTGLDFLDPIPLTFGFDEDVTGFDVTDINVTNGSVGNFNTIDAASYSAEVTPDGGGDLTVSVTAGVAQDSAGNGNTDASETSTVDSAWGLVWSDDFDGGGLDAGLWTARTSAPGDCPDPCDGSQTYLTERVSVGSGLLTIEAQSGTPFTSGIIDTRDKRSLKYGRVEIDAVMPGTQGTWPSLRLLPAIPGGETEPEYGPWPQSGEIDLVNAPNLGPGNSTLEHTLRYGLPQPEDTATTATSTAPGVPTIDIIEYAIEWEAGEIRWFVNDVHVATQTQDNWYAYFEDADGVFTLGSDAAPFDQEFYVVIGLAIGNNPDSFFPQTLQVDAVRVYECVNATDPNAGTGCSTGSGVPAESAPSAPYTEMVDLYTDAPATLNFVEPDGVTITPATVEPGTFTTDPSVVVTINPAATDATDTFVNVDVQATVGNLGSFDIIAGTSRYFDLSGGGTAGEVLFRMRVNSASPGARLEAGLYDRGESPVPDRLDIGTVPLEFTADGQWRNYSAKIADIVNSSVFNGAPIDLADIFAVAFDVIDGSANFDVDDISIKVACRDMNACEVTPRVEPVPATIVFEEDFEGLNAADPQVLGGNTLGGGVGFIYFASVWDGPVGDGVFQYQYGPAPAPNGTPGFSSVATGEAGPEQGGANGQYVTIYSDYNNLDHGNGLTINTSVFLEPRTQASPITAGDIGSCWTFEFDYKAPAFDGIADPQSNAEANAFIVTLNPMLGFAATNDIRFDTTGASTTDWVTASFDIDLADSALVGQILQFGFNTRATNFEDSGVFYDNIVISSRPGACPADP